MLKDKNQLKEAKEISDSFSQKYPDGSFYVYVYEGIATIKTIPYTQIDGVLFAEKPQFKIKEPDSAHQLYYVGRGVGERINQTEGHTFLPLTKYRHKVRENLSEQDAILLEAQLIKNFGHLLEATPGYERGCLINILRSDRGLRCCKRYDADIKRQELSHPSLDVIVLTGTKKILFRGSAAKVAKAVGINWGAVLASLSKEVKGAWSPVLKRPVYFCLSKDLENFVVNPISMHRQLGHKIIIATHKITGKVCKGTAQEIGKANGIHIADGLHKVARGERQSCEGWTAVYALEPLT